MSDFFFDLYGGLPQAGPGDPTSTARALALMTGLPARPRILDVGCGPGRQTFDLADHPGATLVAVDHCAPYVEQVAAEAARRGLGARVEAIVGDMFDLAFPDASFDAIWAEGAIYIIGFDRGVREWRRLLKAGGYLAATELTWLRPDPPEEVRRFWAEAYPSMRDIETNLAAARPAGYETVGHFVLPESAWWGDYYGPLERRLASLRQRHAGDEKALRLLEDAQREIDLYRAYPSYYGYVFYVLRRGEEGEADRPPA